MLLTITAVAIIVVGAIAEVVIPQPRAPTFTDQATTTAASKTANVAPGL
jgi:hypothetical protein